MKVDFYIKVYNSGSPDIIVAYDDNVIFFVDMYGLCGKFPTNGFEDLDMYRYAGSVPYNMWGEKEIRNIAVKFFDAIQVIFPPDIHLAFTCSENVSLKSIKFERVGEFMSWDIIDLDKSITHIKLPI